MGKALAFIVGTGLALTISSAEAEEQTQVTYDQFRQMHTKTEFDRRRTETKEEKLKRLNDYWMGIIQQRLVSSKEVWEENPEEFGYLVLWHGSRGAVGKGAIPLYDKDGNLYYGLPNVQYLGMISMEEHQRRQEEHQRRQESAIVSIWEKELQKRPLTIEEMIQVLPKSLRGIPSAYNGINGILEGHKKIVTHVDNNGTTYYGLSN